MKPVIYGKTWKQDIQSVGITYIPTGQVFDFLSNHSDVIICSRCSKTKSDKLEAIPKEFYINQQNLRFYRWCETFNFPYMILSDLHGALFFDDKVKAYDKHPSTLSDADFKQLAIKISKKMKERRYAGFLFYNTSPIMSVPYFYMLLLTEMPVYFCTKLPKSKIQGFFI